MEEKKEPSNRRVKMGDKGNYNESVGRDYIQGDVYNINISQDKDSKVAVNKSESQRFEASDNEQNLIVNSSGKWVMLKGYFFESTKIRTYQDNKITVKICSNSAEEDANIRSLRPDSYRGSDIIAFAYRNDGFFVKVDSVEEECEDDTCIWFLTLIPENIQYGGNVMEPSYSGHERHYSADDFAELRGRRILLDDPPKPNTNNYYQPDNMMVEMFISSSLNTNRNIRVDSCILKELYVHLKDTPKEYLELSRLAAMFYLKAADVVEQILELSLELIEQNKVHVKFRGKRRKVYCNAEPVVIQIEGDCCLL